MNRVNRREFVKVGTAAGLGSVLLGKNSAGASNGSAETQGTEHADFRTRHLVMVILGNGARKKDVVGNADNAPHQSALMAEATTFTEDYGEAVHLHGPMVSELLSGVSVRHDCSQRPEYPTWNEYIRRYTGGTASEFWMLQSVSHYRAWSWDVKHFSNHGDYGARYGATNLTVNQLFREERPLSADQWFDRHVDERLGHTEDERRRIIDWADWIQRTRAYQPMPTKTPVIERELQLGDARALQLVPLILKTFKPRVITVHVLGLDDAHDEFAASGEGTMGLVPYIRHLKTTDELIGNLWRNVQSDPALKSTTALVVRPECGRDGQVNALGQLAHSAGDYHAHTVWTMAAGPDFHRGRSFADRVERTDLAPTLTYLMTGKPPEFTSGRIRREMFKNTALAASS